MDGCCAERWEVENDRMEKRKKGTKGKEGRGDGGGNELGYIVGHVVTPYKCLHACIYACWQGARRLDLGYVGEGWIQEGVVEHG